MVNVFNKPPTFADYSPDSPNTKSIQQWFDKKYGGPSLLSLSTDKIEKIPTSVENSMNQMYSASK